MQLILHLISGLLQLLQTLGNLMDYGVQCHVYHMEVERCHVVFLDAEEAGEEAEVSLPRCRGVGSMRVENDKAIKPPSLHGQLELTLLCLWWIGKQRPQKASCHAGQDKARIHHPSPWEKLPHDVPVANASGVGNARLVELLVDPYQSVDPPQVVEICDLVQERLWVIHSTLQPLLIWSHKTPFVSPVEVEGAPSHHINRRHCQFVI
mmetsp:Transcript_52308/g.124818  ORF Transcript_52308/g.124818 Transcript_52308/m.124818 type:complete len:207 (-) Transcript_52308:2674-3294(-)